VAGEVVIDITDLDVWTASGIADVRLRCWAIERAPAGATVRLRVGEMAAPTRLIPDIVSWFTHKHLVVEAREPDVVRRWFHALRGIDDLRQWR
jgi:hypothetical protein